MKKIILVVDDDESILSLTSRIIEDAGWDCYTATNAEGGIQLFKKLYPPLVITDLRLEDQVGGVNLMKEIKNLSPLTIVVAMSGMYAESYTVSNLRREGFDALIQKPVTAKMIQSVLRVAASCRNAWDDIQNGL